MSNVYTCRCKSCLEIWGRPLLHDTISKYLKLKHNHDLQPHLPAYMRIDTLLLSNKVNNSTELEALLSHLFWHQKKCDKRMILPPNSFILPWNMTMEKQGKTSSSLGTSRGNWFLLPLDSKWTNTSPSFLLNYTPQNKHGT